MTPPALPATLALETIERSLRQLIEHVFRHQFGAAWLERITTSTTIEKWTEKRAVEERRRTTRGLVAAPASLLDYSEFYELISICDRNWTNLSVALGEKRDTLALLRRFDQLRNTVAHSRPLVPFEEDLLSGIAGEIRNRVTIYMSAQPSSNEFWARIESVTDSFGNVIDGLSTVDTSNPVCATGITLRVGDIVTFRCNATDPEGREISWNLFTTPNDYGVPGPDTQTGDSVEMKWEVLPGQIGARTLCMLQMHSDNTSHRWDGRYDGLAMFSYTVLPSPIERDST